MTDGLRRHTVSFIIPVLNGEKYIKGCLDSIIREMDGKDEIIVVDNGSSDDTLKIARQYDKVRVLQFPDVTIAALRNRGAETSKGDILAFIDSDCLLNNGWRSAVESVMSDGTIKATGSFCDILPSANWIEKAWWSLKKYPETKVHYIPSGNFVIRKEVFEAVSGFNEKLITDEDTEIGVRLSEMGFVMLETYSIGVVHLGNAKTLKEFIKKERWHSTSMLNTMAMRGVDKPMMMTFVFMVCCLFSLFWLPLSLFYRLNPFIVIPVIFLAPLVTVLYRVLEYRNYGHFFQLFFLYLLFYSIRSITIMGFLFKRCSSK
jgi:glycosyltransferase involved in cell wall biosynthesis